MHIIASCFFCFFLSKAGSCFEGLGMNSSGGSFFPYMTKI